MVVWLDAHLENHHTEYLWEGWQGQAANQSRPGTKITEWFAGNRKWPGAVHIKYSNFPCYFTWNKYTKSPGTEKDGTEHIYNLNREGENVFGHIFTVSPGEGERYYPRTLLFHVAEATSFEDI